MKRKVSRKQTCQAFLIYGNVVQHAPYLFFVCRLYWLYLITNTGFRLVVWKSIFFNITFQVCIRDLSMPLLDFTYVSIFTGIKMTEIHTTLITAIWYFLRETRPSFTSLFYCSYNLVWTTEPPAPLSLSLYLFTYAI